MENNDDHLKAWLDELEPDEPLTVAQSPIQEGRRFNPLMMGVLALGILLVGGMGMAMFGGRDAPADQGAQIAPSSLKPSDAPVVAQPLPEPTQIPVRSEGAETLGAVLPGQPVGTEGSEPIDDVDPYDQSDETTNRLAQLVVNAGSQWMTHASAEEMVRRTIEPVAGGIGKQEAFQVRAVQSLPLANVGRLVQVKAWSTDGVQGLWVVPIREDGVVLAKPWLLSSAQNTFEDIAPQPEGKIEEAEIIKVLTEAGWTNVTVKASGPHPSLPEVLIASVTAIPPQGKQPVESTIWLGGKPQARHVMGV